MIIPDPTLGGLAPAGLAASVDEVDDFATKREVKFDHSDGSGSTRFIISELPFDPSWEISEIFRMSAGPMDSLTRLDRAAVDKIWANLSQGIRFSNDLAVDPQALAGAEATAFRKLKPRHKYELINRGLMINFIEPSHVGQLRSAVEEATNQSGPTTSPPGFPPSLLPNT